MTRLKRIRLGVMVIALVGLVVALSTVVAQTQSPAAQQPVFEFREVSDLQRITADYHDVIARVMQQAASSVSVSIIPSGIATATMGEVFIANAPVMYDADSPLPRTTMFAYISLGSQRCASLPSAGYYSIEQYAGLTDNSPYVRLIDLSGNIIIEDIPVHHQEMTMPINPDNPEEPRDEDAVEANITTSAETMGIIITIHRRKHKHGPVSEWTWDVVGGI
jgi:hypothetical protein